MTRTHGRSSEVKIEALLREQKAMKMALRETQLQVRDLERGHAAAADGDMGLYRLIQCTALLLREHVQNSKEVSTLEEMYLDELLTEYQANTQEDVDGNTVTGVKRRRLSRAGPECDRSFAGSSSGAAAAAAAVAAGSAESDAEE